MTEFGMVVLESPELLDIEKSRAETIKQTFEPMATMLANFEAEYLEITTVAEKEIDKEVTKKAKRLRLDIAKIRIATEKTRKEQKEEYLRAGKAIDGVSNILKWAVVEKEKRLEDIEKHFENMEKQRLEKLQSDRVEMLLPFVDDAEGRKLFDMDDDVWQAYFDAKKKEYNDRIQAERKAEEERIEAEKKAAEEREKIRLENEQLKKEAEAREKVEQERRKKEEAERKAREEEARKEREKAEAALQAEREKAEAIQRKAAEEKAAFENQIREKEEAERKARDEEAKAKEEALEKELSKKDTDKLKDLADDLLSICKKYQFQSIANKQLFEATRTKLMQIVAYLKSI